MFYFCTVISICTFQAIKKKSGQADSKPSFPLVCAPQLIRKEGDFHTPRLLDEKEMRANEDMQLKKKNRKSGTPCKVREQDGRGGKVSASEFLKQNGLFSVFQRDCVIKTD